MRQAQGPRQSGLGRYRAIGAGRRRRMVKASGVIVAAGLVLGGGAAAQMFGPGGGSMGQPFGGLSGQEMREMQKAQIEIMKEMDPELYELQEKLRGVEEKIQKVRERLAKREIDKAAAKEELLPLVKERQALVNDPDFLAEQQLAGAVFSSPEFQARMEKIMRRYAPKPPAALKAPAPKKAGR